jgi:cytochrome c1
VKVIGLLVVFLLAGCDEHGGGGTSGNASAQAGDPAEGKRLISHYSCSSCHVIPGVTGASLASGLQGPSLEGLSKRSQLAGGVENTAQNLAKWIMDPQAIKPGTTMPKFSATEREARDMAAYLRSVE